MFEHVEAYQVGFLKNANHSGDETKKTIRPA